MRAKLLPSIVLAGALVALAACSSNGSTAVKKTSKPTSSSSTAKAGKTVDPASIPAAKSAGCSGAAASVTVGQTKVTTTSSGEARWYYQDVPPAHNGTTPVPLVLDFHGYSEGADVHLQMSGLTKFGATKGFATLTPMGTGPVPRWDTTLGSKDLIFTGEMLDAAERNLCIDTNRVYVTGLSNGAFMTSAVACAYSDRVAAVAPVAGVRNIDGCAPKRAVPIVTFHGTADGYVSFNGGLGQKGLDLPAPDGSGKKLRDIATPSQLAAGGADSIPKIMEAWAKRSGCGTGTKEQKIAADVVQVSYACSPGSEAILYRVEGGGHTWPGSPFSQSIVTIVGPTTMNINADEIMWDFFMKHPLGVSKA